MGVDDTVNSLPHPSSASPCRGGRVEDRVIVGDGRVGGWVSEKACVIVWRGGWVDELESL